MLVTISIWGLRSQCFAKFCRKHWIHWKLQFVRSGLNLTEIEKNYAKLFVKKNWFYYCSKKKKKRAAFIFQSQRIFYFKCHGCKLAEYLIVFCNYWEECLCEIPLQENDSSSSTNFFKLGCICCFEFVSFFFHFFWFESTEVVTKNGDHKTKVA